MIQAFLDFSPLDGTVILMQLFAHYWVQLFITSDHLLLYCVHFQGTYLLIVSNDRFLQLLLKFYYCVYLNRNHQSTSLIV